MTRRIEVELEFLRRLFGFGEDSGTGEAVFPNAWPDLSGARTCGAAFVAPQPAGPYFYGNRQQLPVARQGWQAGQMWQRAPVEHAQTTWNAVHIAASRLLTLQTRGADARALTQVWLTVENQEERAIGHWLGQRPHPHFEDFYQAPLPTLTAPPGWQMVPQGGSGGRRERLADPARRSGS